MATDTQVPAFSAFETQLKTLCLKEFPCGRGAWREGKSRQTTKKSKKIEQCDKTESRFIVTLKDYGSQIEKTETLEEYVGSAKSPWHLDYSWSKEAKPLREIAVKSPWLIDDKFVLSYFKTLRIVNRNVSEIDPNLLKFTNLEELTLSCNFLSQIESKNLPPNLKVLEMCANEISDLSTLCVKPPKLIHLGLGYNKISFIGDYLTSSYWPCLLSLDLSNNSLSDLLDVVHKVGSMPKLRNLVLQGNPLSLIPGYRGYTVDSMKKLSVLDDIMISADERHYYKGLARRREYILDEAKVKLSVTYIKGVPQPEELKYPEDQPEFPVIERKYFVQFMFLEDTSAKLEGFHMHGEDELETNGELSMLPTDRTEGQDMENIPESAVDLAGIEKNVYFTEEPDTLHTIDTAASGAVQTDQMESPDMTEKKREEKLEDKEIKISAVNSQGFTWGDEIECNWTQMVVRDDLLGLREFFKQGMKFSVVEEMTLGYPVIPEEPEEAQKRSAGSSRGGRRSVASSKRSAGSSRERRSRSSSKVEKHPGKSPSPATKGAGKDKKDNKKDDKAKSGGKDKDKKKKKDQEVELKRSPPTYTTLATWHMPLAEFLEGEFEYQSVYTQGGVEVASTIKSMDTDSRKGSRSRASGRLSRDGHGSRRASQSSRSGLKDDASSKSKKGKDKKGDKDKKKPPSAGKKRDESKDKSKERKPSASKQGKDAKGDKGKGAKGAPAPGDEEEDPGPPPPLEVHIAVKLHHWKTAMDLLRDEEEKNKAEEQQEVQQA